jgi:hypothetical protein
MTPLGKFEADIRRCIKHERAAHGGQCDALRVAQKIAETFCACCPECAALAEAIGAYWLRVYIKPAADLASEPSQEHIDWLVEMLAFLSGIDAGICVVPPEDWREIRELVSCEAGTLPLDLLSRLMSALLDKRALD